MIESGSLINLNLANGRLEENAVANNNAIELVKISDNSNRSGSERGGVIPAIFIEEIVATTRAAKVFNKHASKRCVGANDGVLKTIKSQVIALSCNKVV